jgi:hypothetical protein
MQGLGETNRAVFIREVTSREGSLELVLTVFDYAHTVDVQLHIDHEHGEHKLVRCVSTPVGMEYPQEAAPC